MALAVAVAAVARWCPGLGLALLLDLALLSLTLLSGLGLLGLPLMLLCASLLGLPLVLLRASLLGLPLLLRLLLLRSRLSLGGLPGVRLLLLLRGAGLPRLPLLRPALGFEPMLAGSLLAARDIRLQLAL